MKIELYPEVCCEYCGDTIHNHFNCPCCHVEGAGTSIYCDAKEGFEDGDDTFTCQACGKEFRLVEDLCYNDWEVEIIN